MAQKNQTVQQKIVCFIDLNKGGSEQNMRDVSKQDTQKGSRTIKEAQVQCLSFIDLNSGGGTTAFARTIKSRYGNLGRKAYVPKHKAESSGVLVLYSESEMGNEDNK